MCRSAKSDDTVYYEPGDEDVASSAPWAGEIEEEDEEAPELPDVIYPVIKSRRRSRSVGSRPLFIKKPEASKVPLKPIQPEADSTFASGLRQYGKPARPGQEAPRITKPMPFNLTAPKRRVTEALGNPSMAEGVERWEKKTPERFHSLRTGQVPVLEVF